jgi:putative spermidine/putrescine transport system ATP-binding protein
LPHELSGGQQQRVALARCFVYRPNIILLDEPLGALDKNLREHMQLEIRKLHRDLGATFIYVTHDQEEALTLSDRVCLMNQAQVEQIGTPQEIYDQPASRFAASFIGHSNLLSGTVVADGGNGAHFQWNEHALPVTATYRDRPQSATLMVRPEAARLVAPDTAFLMGQVSEVVFRGSDLKLIVNIDAATRFSVRTSSHGPRPMSGETVGIRWDPNNSVVLIR